MDDVIGMKALAWDNVGRDDVFHRETVNDSFADVVANYKHRSVSSNCGL